MHDPGLDPELFASFLDALRRFVRERLVPAEATVISADRIPAELLDEMSEFGLFGLTIPVEFGGAGLSLSQYLEVILELSWAAPAFRSVIAIGTGVVATALKLDGTEEQKALWLPQLVDGAIASFGLTEPDSGSDSAGMKTSAVKDGDHYVLNGTKRYITNAPMARFALVMARTSRENLPGNAHVSAFLVPTDAPGVSIGRPDQKMGQRGALTADLILQDVRLEASALLGGVEGRGFKTAMKALDGGRLSVAAGAIGYARRILASGLQYATERKAFGEPIANFQLIQAMLADSQTELYAAECMLRDVARLAAAGERISTKAACVKMFASEACGRIADRTVQIYGGAGYMAEYEVERFFRDSRVYRIYEGTTQILQLVIARAMLKELNEV
ncbi:acyl-CoA dehydrogenase family protein [Phenylobacterium sp. LjRoot219]|uniref:acyl-CoA dehydrogenase family protein n=1 Tax=Phenylobacterium sp. LjRoot219 TaxID=3342283 RepID=UPI003ECD41A4